jgi:hypothetical protein
MAVIAKGDIATWVNANGATYAGHWVVLRTSTPTVVCAVRGDGTPVIPPEVFAYAGTGPNMDIDDPNIAGVGDESAVCIIYFPRGML